MSRQPSGAGADRRQFLMGPIEKFLRHRRVPFKLIANVLLVVLLTCLVQLYVAPLQTALGKERHRLVEAILTLPTDDGLPDSYQSKWHGDYADTPRVAVVDSSGAAEYMLHIPSLLRAESSATKVAIEVTFNEFSDASSGGMPLALSGLKAQWSSGLVNPINSSANSLLDIGLAMHHFLMESTNDAIKAALRSVAALTTIDCGATLPSSALCDGPNGYKMMCAPCVPPAWVALRSEDNGDDVRDAWAAMRLVQYVSSMAVSCSWTTVVSTWQGVQKSGGMGNDESLDRTWDTRVTLTKMYGLSMRIEPTVFCTTTRKGFFSSDNELSPDDGFAVVALIVGLNVMSLVDCALRIRALLVVRKEGGDVGFGVDGASNDSGDDVSLAPQGRQHSAQQDESDEGEDDRIDSNAAMIRPAVVNSSEWSNFLLRNKGKKWHMTAIVADILVTIFCAGSYAERGGVSMSFARWSALQFVFATAVFAHCLGLVGFLRFTPRAYILIRATQRAFGRLLMMLFGILPCYIGFVLLFHIAFGAHSSGEFSTFGGSCIALFFMMFGDNLLPAFRLIDGSHEWWMRAAADVAGCLYVTVFMGIVLNMSVAIVVDTYKFVSRESNIILLDEPEADELLQTEEMRREQQLQRDALIQSLKEEVVSQLQMIKQLQQKDKRPSVPQL